MNFKDFIININKFKWGLVSANTYHQNCREYIYIMISEKGNSGRFEKREVEIEYLDNILDEWFDDFVGSD